MAVLPYRVTLRTTKGIRIVDLSGTQGADAAGRRAWLTLVHTRKFGDVDQVTVVEVQNVCAYSVACDSLAVTTLATPFAGELPICQGCADLVARLTPTQPTTTDTPEGK
jgi:hypothetical protein